MSGGSDDDNYYGDDDVNYGHGDDDYDDADSKAKPWLTSTTVGLISASFESGSTG